MRAKIPYGTKFPLSVLFHTIVLIKINIAYSVAFPGATGLRGETIYYPNIMILLGILLGPNSFSIFHERYDVILIKTFQLICPKETILNLLRIYLQK